MTLFPWPLRWHSTIFPVAGFTLICQLLFHVAFKCWNSSGLRFTLSFFTPLSLWELRVISLWLQYCVESTDFQIFISRYLWSRTKTTMGLLLNVLQKSPTENVPILNTVSQPMPGVPPVFPVHPKKPNTGKFYMAFLTQSYPSQHKVQSTFLHK